jgi:dihydroneopterin aldolase
MACRSSQGEGANFVFRCYGTYAETCNYVESIYPNLIHFICLAHVLQHVAEEVRAKFPQVNKLILMTKRKCF